MPISSDKRWTLILAAILVLATVAVYWQVVNFKFVDFDDHIYVTENQHLRNGLSARGLTWAFTSVYGANWHPLTWMSHMLDYQLFGLDPAGHHVTSVIFHILNTLLLFLVLKRMTRSTWRSAFVAGLFGLHPMHVESVAWVSERKDVLSAFFWMLTMWAYVRYVEHRTTRRYALVALAFALGLMAKSMLVSLPIVLLILDYWPLGRVTETQDKQARVWWSLIREKLPLFALAGASCVITYIAQRNSEATQTLQAIPFSARLANAFLAYASYVGNLLWPRNMGVLYPHPGIDIPILRTILSAVMLVYGTYLILRHARRVPNLAAGWLWFVITLVPVIGLVQVGMQAMADRYSYIPSIGLFIGLAWGAPDLFEHRLIRSERLRLLAIPACLSLAILAVLAWYQVGTWRNNDSLYENAIAVTNGRAEVRTTYAVYLARQGRLADAKAELEKALKANPNYPDAHNDLGYLLVREGREREGVEHYVQALRIDPNYADALNNLGASFARRGMANEALRCFERAVKLAPGHAEARHNLAYLLYTQGRTAEAVEQFKKALRIEPRMSVAQYQLGVILLQKGNAQGAIQHIREAVRLNPSFGPAHKSLAQALAKSGDYDKAWKEIGLAKKLGETVDPRFASEVAGKVRVKN